MNKIGRWHKLKKVLPHYRRAVLLDRGDDDYAVSRLNRVEEDGTIIFLSDGMNDPILTRGEDVKRWAYIRLE